MTENKEYIVCPVCRLPAELQDFCEHCKRLNINIDDPKAPAGMPEFLSKDVKTGTYFFKRSRVKPIVRIFTLSGSVLSCFLFIRGLINMGSSFSILQVIIFGLLAYILFMFSFNKTGIFISPDQIRVKRGPIYLPLADSFILKKEDIRRLDIFRQVHRGKYKNSVTFSSKIITKKNASLDLFDFKDVKEAVDLYRFINKLLDLKRVKERLSQEKAEEFKQGKASLISNIYYGPAPIVKKYLTL